MSQLLLLRPANQYQGVLNAAYLTYLASLPTKATSEAWNREAQNNGWILMAGNADTKLLDLNKGYTPSGFAAKVYHLHIKPSGDWDELYFRDYLQQHYDVAKQYEILKLSLKKQFEHNRDAYTKAKSEFVRMHTQKARKEFGQRYLPIQL